MLTPEQLELRRSGYGASDIASLVGIGAGTPIDIYESKVLPPKADEVEHLAMDLGNLLEEPVAQVYAKRTNSLLRVVPTMRHGDPKFGLALATPDRARFITNAPPAAHVLSPRDLATADRLVEVKTHAGRFRRDYGMPGTSEVPEDKALQVTWQMGVAGLEVCDIAVLFRGDFGVSMEIYTVPFNRTLFESAYELVARFHRDHVVPRKPPPPDASDRYDEFLKRAYPIVGPPAFVATPEEEELMLRFAKLKTASKRLEKLLKKTKQDLVQRIGNAEGITSASFGALTYRRNKDTRKVGWEQVAQDALTLAGQLVGAMPAGEVREELAARIREIVPNNTREIAGHRTLRTKWLGEADFQTRRLEMALDALEAGAEASE